MILIFVRSPAENRFVVKKPFSAFMGDHAYLSILLHKYVLVCYKY